MQLVNSFRTKLFLKAEYNLQAVGHYSAVRGRLGVQTTLQKRVFIFFVLQLLAVTVKCESNFMLSIYV